MSAPASAPASLDSELAFLRDELREVERTLIDGTASIAPLIPQVTEYTCAGGGKRIRPILVLLGARLFGPIGRRAIRVAACAEWLHSASLMHDDVIDGATTRRGRSSANALFGSREAVLVGDFLYSKLCRVLVEDGNREILLGFAQSIGDLAEGEVLQLSRSFDLGLDEATYLDVIGRKTSSLLATAIEAGAILGGAKPDEQRSLREYGWQLGLAFQLVDDALDYTGTREELGKAPLTDLAEGKITLPLMLAFQACDEANRGWLAAEVERFAVERETGRPPEAERLQSVARCVEHSGGIERTLARARGRVDAAIGHLGAFDDSEARRALTRLARFVVERRG